MTRACRGILVAAMLALPSMPVRAAPAAAAATPPIATDASQACPRLGTSAPPREAIPEPRHDASWTDPADKLDAVPAAELKRTRVLLIGDSYIAAWNKVVFDHFYGRRAALNFGILGDTTESLLWRLARLPLGTILRPELVILLIGNNDLFPDTDPANVAIGVTEIIHQIRVRSPSSKILLVGLLPEGEAPDYFARALRVKVNLLLARCTDPMVSFIDPGDLLLDGGGTLTTDFSSDHIHPTQLGYAIFGAALEPKVRAALDGH